MLTHIFDPITTNDSNKCQYSPAQQPMLAPYTYGINMLLRNQIQERVLPMNMGSMLILKRCIDLVGCSFRLMRLLVLCIDEHSERYERVVCDS